MMMKIEYRSACRAASAVLGNGGMPAANNSGIAFKRHRRYEGQIESEAIMVSEIATEKKQRR